MSDSKTILKAKLCDCVSSWTAGKKSLFILTTIPFTEELPILHSLSEKQSWCRWVVAGGTHRFQPVANFLCVLITVAQSLNGTQATPRGALPEEGLHGCDPCFCNWTVSHLHGNLPLSHGVAHFQSMQPSPQIGIQIYLPTSMEAVHVEWW